MGVVVGNLDAAERDIFHALQFVVFRLAVQHLDVGQVGDVAETVALHGEFLLAMMPAPEGDDLHGRVRIGLRRKVVVAETALPAEHLFIGIGMHPEGLIPVDGVDMPFRRTRIFRLGKGVGIFAVQTIGHIGLAVDIHRVALREVEGADVVQARRMIFVVVREQDGVEVVNIRTQHLVAEVRSGIDQDGQAAVFDQRSGTQALIARVRRTADRAVAGNHRDTGRGARAEECTFGFLFHTQSMTISTSVPTSAGS